MDVAFYTVSSREYFLGAVALINSLRIQGHNDPVYVLDRGLADEQRARLEPHATVVPGPAEAPPHLLKAIAPNRHPAEVMVLLDADILAVRPLHELIEKARPRGAVAFQNNEDRWEPRWGELLDLGDLQRRHYVSSAFVVLAGDLGREVVRLVDDRVDRVDVERSFYEIDLLDPSQPAPDYPLALLDQDVLNAVLAAVVPQDRAIAIDRRGMSLIPYEGVELVDDVRMRCRYAAGGAPYLLHHVLPGKPWLQATPESPYSRLLRRALTGPDLAIEVPREALPLHLRGGPVARLDRACRRLAVRARMAAAPWRARVTRRFEALQ